MSTFNLTEDTTQVYLKNKTVKAAFDAVHPVGSIYLSDRNAPPAMGTWEAVTAVSGHYAWKRTK